MLAPEDQAAVDRFNALEEGATGDGVEGATGDAVKAAKAAGLITDMDAGAVAVLMRMAERMDDPDFPYIEGKFDNVTEGLYTKLSNELGLTVAGRARTPEKKEASRGKLGELRSIEGTRRRSTG